MRSRARLLKELISESLYVADEQAIADAIVARAMVRLTVAEPMFRGEDRAAQRRSFQRDPAARSFRLSHAPGLRRLGS